MRISLGIGMAFLAASLAAPAAWAQATTSRQRTTGQIIVQRDGGSYLGIGVVDITSERAKALNLKEERGAEVSSVREDSPASKAGIKEGDVVLEYNGQPVQGGEQLTRLVRETPVGRQAKMVVWRNGASQTLTATIEEQKGTVLRSSGGTVVFPNIQIPMPQIEIPRFQLTYQNPMLGIEGESLGSQEQLAEFFGVKEGVLVKVVRKNSAAEKAGIKAGDVIVKVDDSKVTSTTEITRALRGLQSKKTFTVMVVRNKKEMALTVTLEGGSGAIRAAAARRLQC
jgi:serine protease Do